MDELDRVLMEYQQPLTEETNETKPPQDEGTPGLNPASETTTTQGNETPAPSDGGNWFNNPLYYQSGKKQGQLKPLGRKKVNVPTDNSDAVLSGAVIDGALFLMLIDLLVPFLISVLNNKFSDKKIKDSDLQLTSEQKKKLEPLADRVVQMMSLKANPVVLLTMAMTGIYGLNFMAAKMGNDEK